MGKRRLQAGRADDDKEAQHYRALFQLAGVGIGITEAATGEITQANRRFGRLLGYRPEELVGRKFRDLTHPDDRAESSRQFRRLVTGEIDEIGVEKRYLCKDGKFIWAALNATLIADEAGEPSRVATIIQDISARKRAENALRASEQRFRLMTGAIEGVFWMSTPGMKKVLYVSPGYERIWGSSCHSLYRQPHSFMDAVHPEDRSRVQEGLTAHANGDWECEYRIIRPDGAIRWIGSRGFPIRDENGTLYCLTGLAMDITDRKDAELRLVDTIRALHQNSKYLERVNSELEQFAGTVSHDLKAPLRAISGLAAMIEEELGEKMEGEAQQYIEQLHNRVQRMEQLITGLLEYSRAGHDSRCHRVIDVGELINQQLATLDIPGSFEVTAIGVLPTIETDPIQLGQVFANLIDNAVRHHHMEHGKVWIRARANERFCEFAVADDGPGIPLEDQERVFRMFECGNERGEDSTGVGLALVKKLVDGNGGTITVDSNPGNGAEFRFTWPACPGAVGLQRGAT